MGAKVTVEGDPLGELLRDAVHLYTYGEPVDQLVQYIGLTGLQHAGVGPLQQPKIQKRQH